MIRARVISAAVLVVLVMLAVFALPPGLSTLAISLLLVACAWEWSAFQGRALPARVLFLLVTGVSCAVLWCLTAGPGGLSIVLWTAVLFWTGAALWLLLLPWPVNRALAWFVGVLVLAFAWVALARMRVDWPSGSWWVMYGLLVVWVADSCAYFAGRRWGGRKLAPKVSPGKTWAGLYGGLVGAALLALVATPWLSGSTAWLVGLTVVVALYSVVGDLTESLFKRHAGMKDSGSLIPGHGGFLDRFDSLLAAAPVLMLGASWLERMPG